MSFWCDHNPRESPLCAECGRALTTRNREDCEANYDPDVAPLGWFDIGEPEGYFCSRCLAYLNCDQTHVGGRSRDYDFSAMERYWVKYDMWQVRDRSHTVKSVCSVCPSVFARRRYYSFPTVAVRSIHIRVNILP